MYRPFLIHQRNDSDLILTPEELKASWSRGRFDPADFVIDKRTGSQFPASLLKMKFDLGPSALDKTVTVRLPQAENPGVS